MQPVDLFYRLLMVGKSASYDLLHPYLVNDTSPYQLLRLLRQVNLTNVPITELHATATSWYTLIHEIASITAKGGSLVNRTHASVAEFTKRTGADMISYFIGAGDRTVVGAPSVPVKVDRIIYALEDMWIQLGALITNIFSDTPKYHPSVLRALLQIVC